MTLNKKLLQTSWSCGDIPILCQPKKVEMQLKRGPRNLWRKKWRVDGVDGWLVGLCWFMVSSLSLSLSIYIYIDYIIFIVINYHYYYYLFIINIVIIIIIIYKYEYIIVIIIIIIII